MKGTYDQLPKPHKELVIDIIRKATTMKSSRALRDVIAHTMVVTAGLFERAAPVDDVKKFLRANGGWYGNHKDAPVEDWMREVANDETRLGYWEWAYTKISK